MSAPKTKWPRAELEKLLNLKKNRETTIKVFGIDPGWPHPIPLDINVKRSDDGDYVFDNPTLTKVHPHAQADDTILRKQEREAFERMDAEDAAKAPPPPETKDELPPPETKDEGGTKPSSKDEGGTKPGLGSATPPASSDDE